jgi:acyl carrier protein
MTTNSYDSPAAGLLGAKGEQYVLGAFRECLDNTEIELDDSFLDAGGDSLVAAMILARCEKAFGIRLQPAALFTHPTARALAAAVSAEYHKSATRGGSGRLSSCLVRLAEGTGAPLFLVHGESGSPSIYRGLVSALGTTRPVYGLRSPDLDWSSDVLDISGLVTHHVTEIRGLQPEGPYALAGAGIGGSLAFEVACRLAEDGQEVRPLIMLDSPSPPDFAGRWYARLVYATLAALRALVAGGIGGRGLLKTLGFRSLNERLMVMFGDGVMTSSELRAVANVELSGSIDNSDLVNLERGELHAKLDRELAVRFPGSDATTRTSEDAGSMIRQWKLRAKNTWLWRRHSGTSRFPGTVVLYCGTNDKLAERWKPHVVDVDARRVTIGVNATGHQAREGLLLAPAMTARYAADMKALLETPAASPAGVVL